MSNASKDERVAKELVDDVFSKTRGLGDGGVRTVLERIIEALRNRLDQLPHPDNTLPGVGSGGVGGERPDNELPGSGGAERPDQGLPKP